MNENIESKQSITPGQALLILLDHYKNNSVKCDELKRLYLSGSNTESSRQMMLLTLKDPLLDKYVISYDPFVINADPSRRYFETHIAYETVTKELGNISKDELNKHFDEINAMIPSDSLQPVQHVLNGEFRQTDNLVLKEYSDYIFKIKNGNIFQDLSSEEKEKVELIVKISFLGVYNAQVNQTALPLNIYGTGIYTERAKGKYLDSNQSSTRNQQLGLMKGHMPLALNDIARSDTELPYLKPSDQSRFDVNAEWVKQNFDTYVHPFANSISGTMLCQLRNMSKLDHDHRQVNPFYSNPFTQSQQKMRDFTKLFMSTMLYGSGGHTLREYSAPLSLPVVKSEFSHVLHEDLTLDNLFYPAPGSAYIQSSNSFDAALEKTIQYNNNYMQKRQLNAQIKGNIIPAHVSPSGKATEYLKANQTLREKEALNEIITSPQYIQWTQMIPEFAVVKNKIESNALKDANQVLDRIGSQLLKRKDTLPADFVNNGLTLIGYIKTKVVSLETKINPVSYYKSELKSAKAAHNNSSADPTQHPEKHHFKPRN